MKNLVFLIAVSFLPFSLSAPGIALEIVPEPNDHLIRRQDVAPIIASVTTQLPVPLAEAAGISVPYVPPVPPLPISTRRVLPLPIPFQQSVLTTVTPSPGASPVAITRQSQLITSYKAQVTLCPLSVPTGLATRSRLPGVSVSPAEKRQEDSEAEDDAAQKNALATAPCSTIYSRTITPICHSTLRPLGGFPITVTDCEQDVTFSTDHGLASGSRPELLTTKYYCVWSNIISGVPTKGAVTANVCRNNGDCTTYIESWGLRALQVVTTETSSISVNEIVFGPAVAIVSPYRTETILQTSRATIRLSTTYEVARTTQSFIVVPRTILTLMPIPDPTSDVMSILPYPSTRIPPVRSSSESDTTIFQTLFLTRTVTVRPLATPPPLVSVPTIPPIDDLTVVPALTEPQLREGGTVEAESSETGPELPTGPELLSQPPEPLPTQVESSALTTEAPSSTIEPAPEFPTGPELRTDLSSSEALPTPTKTSPQLEPAQQSPEVSAESTSAAEGQPASPTVFDSPSAAEPAQDTSASTEVPAEPVQISEADVTTGGDGTDVATSAAVVEIAESGAASVEAGPEGNLPEGAGDDSGGPGSSERITDSATSEDPANSGSEGE